MSNPRDMKLKDGPITDRGVQFEVAEILQADPKVDPKHIGAKSVLGKVF